MENIESSDKKVRRKRQIKRNRMIILRSAKELFHKKGFYTTTMEDIAQYSGFDRRTIYISRTKKKSSLPWYPESLPI